MYQKKRFFRTNSLSAAPYLEIKGLQLKTGELDENGQVYFIFEDPKSDGINLMHEYRKSDFSTYNRLLKFFRKQIDEIRRHGKNEFKEYEAVMYEKKLFLTNSLSVAPFASMHDLKYKGGTLNDENQVVFIFDDPTRIGNELVIDFQRGEFSEYHRLIKDYRRLIDSVRNKVNKAMKGPVVEYYDE